jgi:hypothetical protein
MWAIDDLWEGMRSNGAVDCEIGADGSATNEKGAGL